MCGENPACKEEEGESGSRDGGNRVWAGAAAQHGARAAQPSARGARRYCSAWGARAALVRGPTGVLAFLGVAAAFLAGVLAFLGAAAFLVGVFLTLGAAAWRGCGAAGGWQRQGC
mgnify:CR=1 FL=1